MIFNQLEKTSYETTTEEAFAIPFDLILYNDDVNSFDYVIDLLISTCGHSKEQAEQCAVIVHYKGKCAVKSGSYQTLKPICTTLLEAGLTAEIE